MDKRLGVVGLVVAACLLALGGWSAMRPDRPAGIMPGRNGGSPPGVEPRSGQRGNLDELTVDSLCERLTRAAQRGDEIRHGVFKKIVAQLGELGSGELLNLLEELEVSGCKLETADLESALVSALARRDRVLAADYLVGRHGDDDGPTWGFFAYSFFAEWAREDLAEMVEWLDARAERLMTEARSMLRIAETEVITALLQSEKAAALERARSFPHEAAVEIVGTVFKQRSDLLDSDAAIVFLRNALNHRDHETFVGQVCGTALHRKSFEDLRGFFQKHDASQAEREAILDQAVGMQVEFRAVDDAYLQSVRSFAAEEGLGNVDMLTAKIIGTRSDRDHQDKKAVDELLGYDPSVEALRLFLEMRKSSIEDEQAARVVERLEASERVR